MSQEASSPEILQVHDAAYLAQGFSEIFNEEAALPDYHIASFGKNRRSWVVVEHDDPVKTVRQFLPHCKMPDRFKKNIFYKAQRVNQGPFSSNLLANFYAFKVSNKTLYYKGKLVTNVYRQDLKIKGYNCTEIQEWDEQLFVSPLSHSVVKLEMEDDTFVYIDVCATQLDIWEYGPNGFPYYALEKKLELKSSYTSDRMGPKVCELSEPVLVKNDTEWNAFLAEMEEKFGDEVSLYCEYVDKQFRDAITKKTTQLKNQRKRAKQKAAKQAAKEKTAVEEKQSN